MSFTTGHAHGHRAVLVRQKRLWRAGHSTRRVVPLSLAIIVALLLAPSALSAAPTTGTFLYLNGYPGGQEQVFTPADSTFSAAGSTELGVELFVFPFAGGPCCVGGSWHLMIFPRQGQDFVPGAYEGAGSVSDRDTAPVLEVFQSYGGVSRCSGGRFVVEQAIFGYFNAVVGLDVMFEQTCQGVPVSGRIRIEPPPDLAPPVIIVSDVVVEAPDAIGTAVFYSAGVQDDVDPNPSLDCEPSSGSFFRVGTTAVTCRASDFSGKSSTAIFHVTVLPVLELGVELSTGSVKPMSGLATVRGRVSCTRAATVFISGELSQLISQRATVTGSYSTQVDCAPPSSEWAADVVGTNGRFKAGEASATAFAFNCQFFCHTAFASGTTRLVGAGK